MGDLVVFPVKKICALGVPREIVGRMREKLGNVGVFTDAKALERCDLLVVGEDDPYAFDVASWVLKSLPEFPILFWNRRQQPEALAERCGHLLFAA